MTGFNNGLLSLAAVWACWRGDSGIHSVWFNEREEKYGKGQWQESLHRPLNVIRMIPKAIKGPGREASGPVHRRTFTQRSLYQNDLLETAS